MKKQWLKRFLFLKLSPAVIAAVLFVSAAGVGYWAYEALKGEIVVTIKEPLEWVSPNFFEVEIYASESVTCPLTVRNLASNDIDFEVVYVVVPDLGAEVTLTIPKNLTAPALGQVSFDIVLNASKSAPPIDMVTISYTIVR